MLWSVLLAAWPDYSMSIGLVLEKLGEVSLVLT